MSLVELDPWNIVPWLVTNSVVAGLLAVLAFLCDRVLKRPTLAHLLWVLVLVKLLTPPMVVLPIAVDASRFEWLAEYTTLEYQRLVHTNAAAVADSVDHARLTSIGRSFGTPTKDSRPGELSTISGLLCLWVAGTIGLSVWIVLAARRLELLIQRMGRFDIAATRQLAELMRPQERPAPPVWLVDAVISPMLVGARSDAKIVFPKALWSKLSEEARTSLLLHELEHWRRRDWLVRRVEVVALAMLWWHPLVWFTKRQIEDCEERCCDLAVSRRTRMSPRVYAEAILATLDFLSEPGNWDLRAVGPRPLASGIGYLPRIEQRLREIMSPTADRQLRRTQKILVVAAMIFVIPIYPAIVIHRTPNQTLVGSVVPVQAAEIVK